MRGAQVGSYQLQKINLNLAVEAAEIQVAFKF